MTDIRRLKARLEIDVLVPAPMARAAKSMLDARAYDMKEMLARFVYHLLNTAGLASGVRADPNGDPMSIRLEITDDERVDEQGVALARFQAEQILQGDDDGQVQVAPRTGAGNA